MDQSRPPKAGEIGSQVSGTRAGAPAVSDRHVEPRLGDGMLPEHPASVGISISIGMNTEFGREKVDVTCWCTLPCGLSEVERQAAQDEAAMEVMGELQRRLDETINKFFPELAK